NFHDNVHSLDLQYPWASAWYDRRLSKDTWLRVQPFGGYAWLETDSFVAHGGALLSLSHAFGDRVGAQLFTRLNYNDFKYRILTDPVVASFDPVFAERIRRFQNRDGLESETGVEGTFAVVPGRTVLRAGTAYQRYWSEGRDWDRNGSRTWIGATQALP